MPHTNVIVLYPSSPVGRLLRVLNAWYLAMKTAPPPAAPVDLSGLDAHVLADIGAPDEWRAAAEAHRDRRTSDHLAVLRW